MKKLILLWLLLYLPSGWVFGQETLHKSVINTLVTPTLLLGQARYAQAAESFHQQSNIMLTLERKLGAKAMWQAAGLAEGLAAIAAEKNRDAIAYEYWANSVRYFLMSGANWEQLQSKLHQEFEQSSTRLQVNMAPGDTGSSIDNTWLELFSLVEVWQDKLGYFSYRSPSSDLANQVEQQTQIYTQGSTDSGAKGSQLRQYVPNQPLQLNEAFKEKQAFSPEQNTAAPAKKNATPVTARSVPVVATNRHQQMEKQLKTPPAKALPQAMQDNTQTSVTSQTTLVQDQVVIATPIVVDGEIIEQDHANLGNKQVTHPDIQTESEDKLISRGIIGSESSQGVEASQRRSFAPNPE
ncbi:hypothetical protein VII00023_07899 [Vibrio ichthyoenteri ATCC 700023]|uniref:Uncharacterized protein n=1 Tax=Vibrio ichthyoenteri ATCC 700023 TaxID=870968 RepID=F9S775_9VIBR|nr:hypothetical protein [Vibrio ichthyoenteri]EGU31962.1 hypothetical protein VII00023_07899 [Vibrio ichthyoenteri ATCC 700023]